MLHYIGWIVIALVIIFIAGSIYVRMGGESEFFFPIMAGIVLVVWMVAEGVSPMLLEANVREVTEIKNICIMKDGSYYNILNSDDEETEIVVTVETVSGTITEIIKCSELSFCESSENAYVEITKNVLSNGIILFLQNLKKIQNASFILL